MQHTIEAFVPRPNYAGQKVLLGLSGGINSAALECWLAAAPEHEKPAELHLLTHQFAEHSPDTRRFIDAVRAHAKANFPCVVVAETENSVLGFFEQRGMIPHPKLAVCTAVLKVEPSMVYMIRHDIRINVVGYVEKEQKRIANMDRKGERTDFGVFLPSGTESQFLLRHFTDEWCLQVVDREIGWHPAIYDLRWNDLGFMSWMQTKLPTLTGYDLRAVEARLGTTAPVFEHNNCLPCKNMHLWQMLCVEYFFPTEWAAARATQETIGAHWGRDDAAYYAQFGRPATDEEPGLSCGACRI